MRRRKPPNFAPALVFSPDSQARCCLLRRSAGAQPPAGLCQAGSDLCLPRARAGGRETAHALLPGSRTRVGKGKAERAAAPQRAMRRLQQWAFGSADGESGADESMGAALAASARVAPDPVVAEARATAQLVPAVGVVAEQWDDQPVAARTPAQPHPPLQPGVSFTSSQPRAAQFLAVHARLLGAERVRRGAGCLGRLTASAEDAPLPPRGSLAQARRASAVRVRTIHRRSSALCYARARAPRWSAREATNRALSPRRARCA